jgi:hypothetical protein
MLKRDVSGDPRRTGFHFGLVVIGTEIEVDVPFSGDPEMFKVQPGTFRPGTVVRRKDDPAKILHLTVMAFDVPRPLHLECGGSPACAVVGRRNKTLQAPRGE